MDSPIRAPAVGRYLIVMMSRRHIASSPLTPLNRISQSYVHGLKLSL
jgi:hypothetical protein